MRGQIKFDFLSNATEDNQINFRISTSAKNEAQKKAKSEGLTLSKCIKCFITGYLAGDLLAEELINKYKGD